MKHINIKHYFIYNYIKKKNIKLAYIALEANIANILTKLLNKARFKKLRELIRMKQIVN